MFGKFLLTVAVIAVIWFGFRYLSRLAELRRRDQPDTVAPPHPPGGAAEAETMVECRICGTWQPGRTARSCGRADCPY
ncbi:conserved protein of unknown function [Magnetospirillum sp. XM-1]|uniref:hypothetical protein n=1 Tax=Magnetospirillum sp. XM-1 TaxID=1663591 RepID=UPI00073DD7F1|nr:hypothetical protein [Magnetospirillum sp. XM-1]CUW39987.1 conserved protein of unknown function [Magnetospirillum sp. XM-1]